jgi:hypothetical protein
MAGKGLYSPPKFSLQDLLTKMAFNHGGRQNSHNSIGTWEEAFSSCHYAVQVTSFEAMYGCLGVLALAAGAESALTTPSILTCFLLILRDESD